MTDTKTPHAGDEALLPCPFCGGTPRFDEVEGDPEQNSDVGGHFIVCAKCGCSTPLVFPLKESAKPKLTEMWNRRAQSEGAVRAEGVDEWRCFYCDEVFTDRGAAYDHFGPEHGDGSAPACKLNEQEGGLLRLYREALNEIRRYREEDTDLIREVHGLGAKSERERREWGDKEYAKGLADGRAEAAPLPQHAQSGVVEASSRCPICGADSPHAHISSEIESCVSAQASRFHRYVRVFDTAEGAQSFYACSDARVDAEILLDFGRRLAEAESAFPRQSMSLDIDPDIERIAGLLNRVALATPSPAGAESELREAHIDALASKLCDTFGSQMNTPEWAMWRPIARCALAAISRLRPTQTEKP